MESFIAGQISVQSQGVGSITLKPGITKFADFSEESHVKAFCVARHEGISTLG